MHAAFAQIAQRPARRPISTAGSPCGRSNSEWCAKEARAAHVRGMIWSLCRRVGHVSTRANNIGHAHLCNHPTLTPVVQNLAGHAIKRDPKYRRRSSSRVRKDLAHPSIRSFA